MVEWWIFFIGIPAGVLFRSKGFAIPLLIELGWWTSKLVAGDFSAPQPHDDFAGEAFLSALVGLFYGCLGVAAGIALRWFIDRYSNRPTAHSH